MTDSQPASSADIIRTSRQGRLMAAALAVLGLILFALYQYTVLPFIHINFRGIPNAHVINIVKNVLLCLSLGSILFGYVMIRYGRKILRARQFPLPAAWVWRDTPVKRGRDAARLGWLHIVMGVLIGILCIGLTAATWYLFERMVPHHNLPKGVIILHENIGSSP